METSLRAGLAVYNAGDYHAAHDAWEETWLDLPTDSDDEQFLHGLIQFTAAVYHARSRTWSGASGLCESGRDYLEDLPATYRGVDVDSIRQYMSHLKTDPERIERTAPPKLTHTGRPISAADLAVDGITTAAAVLAAEYDAYDDAVVERAATYAFEEAASSRTQFIGLLTAFVDDRSRRQLIYDRLVRHVERRREKERDVAGLFEPRDER